MKSSEQSLVDLLHKDEKVVSTFNCSIVTLLSSHALKNSGHREHSHQSRKLVTLVKNVHISELSRAHFGFIGFILLCFFCD